MCCSICTFVLLSNSRDGRNLNEFAFEEYSVCTCMQQQNASVGKCFQFYRDCWTTTPGDHKERKWYGVTLILERFACAKIRPLVASTFPIRRMIFMILSRWLAARVILIAFLCISPCVASSHLANRRLTRGPSRSGTCSRFEICMTRRLRRMDGGLHTLWAASIERKTRTKSRSGWYRPAVAKPSR